MSLTSKQRAFLKSEAHTLKPIVQIMRLLKSWKKKLAVIQSLRLDVS